MSDLEFEQIAQLSQEDFSKLDTNTKVAFLKLLKEKSKQDIDMSIPIETYVELGASLGIDLADTVTGTSQAITDVAVKKSVESLSGTQTAITYLKMAQSVYSIAKGEFKWDLLNTVSLLSSTLACLVAVGINVACMGALLTILASNPFSFGLAVVVGIINYFDTGKALAKLKKQYITCYNSYRRIKKLGKQLETNEIVYQSIKRVINGCKEKCNNMINYLKQHEEELKSIMPRKIFVGADFNSFCLFTNVITFIQSSQDLSTTRDGVYNDYIDFVSIEDYIDTHKIMEQDKCRIEYYILKGDIYGLKNFTVALDYLKGFFDTYKLNSNLTKQTKSDIEFVSKCIKELNDTIGTQNLINLQKENEKFLDSRNPQELFNSIYSYLIYSQSMQNSPFRVCSSLLNPQYYRTQDIYEYVSAFNEYPVFLFSKWFFYFGNIMYNDIYIENYKSEIINSYNKDKSLYDYTFFKDLVDNISTFNNYKLILIWLYSIREFLQNILDKTYEKYLPTYATSITQTETEDFTFYTPDYNYLVPKLSTLIGNFVNYLKSYGYDKTKFSYLLENYWLFKNYDKKIEVPFISLDCISSLMGKWDLGSPIGKFSDINDNISCLKNIVHREGFIAKNIKDDFNWFKYWWLANSNKNISFNNKNFINGSYIRSVRDDGKFAFNKKTKLNIDEIDYYGNSKNINDFFYRILINTRDIKYLYAYLVLIFDGRWSFDWGGSFFEIGFWLGKSKKLRDLFFDGYNFSLTNDINTYLYSVWQFIRDERQDIIFYWNDTNLKTFNIKTFVNDMIVNSNYKNDIQDLYNQMKNVYNDFVGSINFDIKFATNSINEEIANFESILDKYVKYDSSLSYAYTDKNNTYLWNLYKTCRDLGVNNKGYITNIHKHLVPVYKLENDYIQLETYYPPMFILLNAQDDSNISQSYYLYNQTAINSLFKIGNEKFDEKVNEFKSLVDLSIQPIKCDINHDDILKNIAKNIEKTYKLNYDELIDRIGTQDEEFIIMENLKNTEILKKNNEKINSENEQLALQTQKEIDNTKDLLDKKKLIKYSLIGGIGFILTKFVGKK